MEKPPKPPHESLIFSAELGDVPELNLHGMRPDEAADAVIAFLHRQFMDGIEVVRIIHGRGTQKLQAVVQQVLKQESIVESFRNSQNPREMNGVIYAVISRRQ